MLGLSDSAKLFRVMMLFLVFEKKGERSGDNDRKHGNGSDDFHG
jgi:hypothetical protein